MRKSWKERYRDFCEWQRSPHVVAPLSEEAHDCHTCHTHYVGNYCPRCGQSAKIGRYSFVKAFLLLLDVWGLGNRGMFRTLRDLILRPGYMIRDYLGGMQMAYFPPFKMFFLLTALSLLVSHGMNIEGRNLMAEVEVAMHQGFQASKQEAAQTSNAEAQTQQDEEAQKVMALYYEKCEEYFGKAIQLHGTYPNLFSLSWLVLFSGVFYIFFRKSPAIPGLRYSEFLVGLVYISNMLSIYAIICDFLCLDDNVEMASYLTMLVPLKQMSGYGWWRTLWSVLLPVLILLLLLGAVFFVGGIAVNIYYYNYMVK